MFTDDGKEGEVSYNQAITVIIRLIWFDLQLQGRNVQACLDML